MKISEIGGEFSLIARILADQKSDPTILVPNGHDSAVVRFINDRIAVSTDSVVEGVHWNAQYFSPEQVGIRALEGATSDLLAVGATPRYFTIGLILPDKTNTEFVDGLYRGLNCAAERLSMHLIGGDTNSGTNVCVVNVTVMGEIPTGILPKSRTGAKSGDKIFISGPLGGSAAGLAALQAGHEGFDMVKRYHLEPKCRNDIVGTVSQIANAVIDVSDGLSSEINHLCEASECGAVINLDAIKAKPGVLEVARVLKIDPVELILHGGEEFELLYTTSLTQGIDVPGIEIGEIVAERKILLKEANNKISLDPGGFVHHRRCI